MLTEGHATCHFGDWGWNAVAPPHPTLTVTEFTPSITSASGAHGASGWAAERWAGGSTPRSRIGTPRPTTRLERVKLKRFAEARWHKDLRGTRYGFDMEMPKQHMPTYCGGGHSLEQKTADNQAPPCSLLVCTCACANMPIHKSSSHVWHRLFWFFRWCNTILLQEHLAPLLCGVRRALQVINAKPAE